MKCKLFPFVEREETAKIFSCELLKLSMPSVLINLLFWIIESQCEFYYVTMISSILGESKRNEIAHSEIGLPKTIYSSLNTYDDKRRCSRIILELINIFLLTKKMSF